MNVPKEFGYNTTNETDIFSARTHLFLGLYLALIGLVATYFNGLVLVTFYRFRRLVTPTALLLINLTIADLGVLIIFPFSSSSNFNQSWLYGNNGCQVYAFMGFFAGTAHICTLSLLAMDRYQIACQNPIRLRDKYNYLKWVNFIWIYSLFWSLMPIFGWGRYGPDTTDSGCTIDWRHNDASYKSFIIFYFLFGFLIPLLIILFCYWNIIKKVKYTSATEKDSAESNGDGIWVKEKTVTFMSVTIIVVFLLTWSPYALLCLWTVFTDASTVPIWLTLIPSLFVKTSTLLNPLIYYLTNRKLRKAFLSSLFCEEIPEPVVIERAVCFLNAEEVEKMN